MDIQNTKKILNDWLKPENNFYFYSYEWAYKDIRPNIICEKFLKENNRELKDYKFMCFHGKVKYLFVCSDRKKDLKMNFYDLDWNLLPFTREYKNSDTKISKPKNLQEMISLSEKLAKDFPFVRVDLYTLNDKIYFGELTFYPGNGMERFEPNNWDYKIGKQLNISKINKNIIKKTLITFFSHSSNLGGAERSLIELIKELKDKDINSHVVLPDKGPIQKKLDQLNIPYDIVNLNWWANFKHKTPNDIGVDNSNSYKNLVNYLPKLSLINPDLIYSNTIVSPWGAVASKFLNKLHIWHIREYGNLDHKLIFNIGYKKTINFIEKNSDLIITNSKSVSDHISKYLKNKKTKVIYNYIKIPQKASLNKIKNPFIEKDSLKIIICGNVSPGKNQLEGIKAVDDLIRSKTNVELLILGTVADQKYFEKISNYIKKNKLKNKIHIINFVNNPYPYIKKSDIVLIPSIKEAYGRTAVEGMILKKVVIASSEGGTKEIIQNGKTGYIYKINDIESLSKIIKKLTDIKLQEKISTSGFNSLKNFNTKEQYGYKIAKIIKQKTKLIKKNNQFLELIKNSILNLHQNNEFDPTTNKNYLEEQKKLDDRLNILNSELEIIKSSKFFKLWPIYNKIKKILKINE